MNTGIVHYVFIFEIDDLLTHNPQEEHREAVCRRIDTNPNKEP